jgi:hypothetical protein
MNAHTMGRLTATVTSAYFDDGVSGLTMFGGLAPEACANARRLAACWNACDFIPTEAIEAYGEAIGKVVGPIGKGHIALSAERDQLRAELATTRNEFNELTRISIDAEVQLAAARVLLTEIQVHGLAECQSGNDLALSDRIRALLHNNQAPDPREAAARAAAAKDAQ